MRMLTRSAVLSLFAFWMAGGLVLGCGSGGKAQAGGGSSAGRVGAGGNAGAAGSVDVNAGSSTGETILFKMESVQGVSRNPPVATVFTLAKASYITRVWTYHYAETIGSKTPTVAFQDTATGKTYGPWMQIGYKTFNGTLGATETDPGNVLGPPDNYWMAYPGQNVPAGTYQVIDSDPKTWCYTSDQGNRGIAWVYGWFGGAPGGSDGGVKADALSGDSGVKADARSGDGGVKADAPSGDGQITVKNLPTSTGASGIDLSGYTTRGSLDPAGSSVTVPSGPTLTVAAGVLGGAVNIGLRPAAQAPTPGAPGYTLISSWYDLATSQLETVTAKDTIVLELPATPPAEAVAHPGLQLLAIVNGITLPLDGTFDAATGKFRVELLGLPPSCSFALAFNPNIQKLSTDDLATPHAAPAGAAWTTLDWWIVFDGSLVKMDGAKKVLAWARTASTTYSNAGLKEPFLRKETVGTKPRWTIHLTTDGSYFSEGTVADHGLFGRQYLSVDRIGSPPTFSLGSGLASVAHEMFHAIFRSYRLPASTICDPSGDCERTHSGINEGMATAVGYWIDQGSPAKPRPSETVRPVSWPFAYFDPSDSGTMYTNQDFYVYLLRVGTLDNFRMQLEALVASVMPASGDSYSFFNAYGAALDAAPTGFGGNFTQTWTWYAADRAYQRTPDGWLWPNEPAGGTPGATYVLDSSLFESASNKEITGANCTPGTNSLGCQLILPDHPSLAAFVVTCKLGGLSLPTAMVGQALKGTFSATASDGAVAFTLFGEKDGKGSESAWLRSASGSAVTLEKVGTDYPTVRMIVVPAGAPTQDVTVQMSFAIPMALKWSDKALDSMTWQKATDYCASLGGRLPTIVELQTLIKNCPQTQTGGPCTVSDTCVSTADCMNAACSGCSSSSSGQYSSFGDTEWFWTSSVASDNSSYAWSVRFQYGRVDYDSQIFTHFVRCVLGS